MGSGIKAWWETLALVLGGDNHGCMTGCCVLLSRSLTLSSCGLVGSVSSNVSRLTSLTRLDLSGDVVQIQLPVVLSALSALRYAVDRLILLTN